MCHIACRSVLLAQLQQRDDVVQKHLGVVQDYLDTD